MKKQALSVDKAEEYVMDTDEKRFHLIQAFLDRKPLNIDYLFDASINRCSYTIQENSEIILSLYDKKVNKRIAERLAIKKIF